MDKENIANCYGISEIFFKGFQSFSSETSIPLRRLTLLYGPNSAGKSAVEDAIALLGKICGRGGFNTAGAAVGRGDALAKHWRRTSDDVAGVSSEMRLGVSARIKGDISWELHQKISERWATRPRSAISFFNRDSTEIVLRCNFHKAAFDPEDSSDIEIAMQYEIDIDGISVLRICELEDYVEINFHHPCLAFIQFEQRFFDPLSELSNHGNLKRLFNDDGWFSLNPFPAYLDRDLRVSKSGFPFMHSFLGRNHPGCEEQVVSLMALLNTGLGDFVVDAINSLMDVAVGELSSCLDYLLVPASRKVPADDELVFVFNQQGQSDPQRFYFQTDVSPLPQNLGAESAFRNLANACYERLRYPIDPDITPVDQPGRLNRFLQTYLFSDRGYAVDYVCRFLMTIDDIQSLKGSGSNLSDEAERFPAIVNLFLRDHSGRAFSFSDVGSGVGYVLPVVNAFCVPEKPILIIQQPELHLHPALQSDLADVLIAGTYGDTPSTPCDALRARGVSHVGFASRRLTDYTGSVRRRVIVETHSEHIMLRLLKRIRSCRSDDQCGELSLLPKDVAVLYFDPQPDGTTRVIQIPIASNGEFGRRWPRGFFTERERDLFDE